MQQNTQSHEQDKLATYENGNLFDANDTPDTCWLVFRIRRYLTMLVKLTVQQQTKI